MSKAAIPFTKTSVVSHSFLRVAVVHVRLIFVGNGVSLRDVVGDPHNSTLKIRVPNYVVVLPHNLKARKLISLPLFFLEINSNNKASAA